MGRLLLSLAGACACALVLPLSAPADSAGTAPAVTTPVVTPVVAPPAAPADGALSLSWYGAYRVGHTTVTVTGRPVRVNGIVRPYVDGQQVLVRIFEGSRVVRSVRVPVTRSAGGTYGHFSVRYASSAGGTLVADAVHDSTAAQRRFSARTDHLRIVRPVAGPGSTGTFVALIQERLAALGYATSRNGVYDGGTARGVLAYRKVNGMARIVTLDGRVIGGLLRGVGGFRVRFPGHGHHVEANLGEQVLAEIDHGRVFRTYVISSGKPSTPTVLGSFRVYRREFGTNSHGMVDSSYFIGGYAIHGYYDVPTYAASHGCLRVPVPDALAIYNWVRFGDVVDVYY